MRSGFHHRPRGFSQPVDAPLETRRRRRPSRAPHGLATRVHGHGQEPGRVCGDAPLKRF
ncbi:hypothetical protein Esi_0183_0036 [Ectocarpus siliculosus]|uniref:Uncharacterized protein n=1 Tax=Ectocarpus siliculosus TaxID=2880 RepID=D7FNY2_ECTSI|nr:hypothetical protein Esi_0183_0036 [Ectocarpus siliculosus]|eukprot:CBJ30251.1 hypothetical protein Esi_0183_0036 [Ectocarpus siliculosus]